MEQSGIYDVKLEQVGFVGTCPNGEPCLADWGFSAGDESYTVEELKDISDKYWADKTPPKLGYITNYLK